MCFLLFSRFTFHASRFTLSLTTQAALLYLGIMVAIASAFSLLVRFSPEVQESEKRAFEAALAERERTKAAGGEALA